MYATAHHVISPRRPAEEGINAFVHMHDDDRYDDIDWTMPDVARIADVRPGRRLPTQTIGLRPGGNRVRSYLDIATSDDRPLRDIEGAVAALRAAIDVARLPYLGHHNGVGLRFGVEFGLESQRRYEFESLLAAAMRLLRIARE